jgi:hypothetical protein
MQSGKAVIDKRVDIAVGYGMDAASAPAIAPVRATSRDEFLPPERHGSITAFSCRDLDFRFVDKFHGCKKQKAPSLATGLFGKLLVAMR